MTDLYRILGMISRGQKHAASVELGHLLRNEPENVQAWSLMALAVEDPRKKMDCYRRVLQIDPGNSNALDQLRALQTAAAAPEAAEPPAPPPAPVCAGCGQTLPEGVKFCPECGTPTQAAPAPLTTPAAPATFPLPAAEPALFPAPVITGPPVPDEIPLDLTAALPDESPPSAEDTQAARQLPEEAIPPALPPEAAPPALPARRSPLLVTAGAASGGCVVWVLSMMLITFLLNTLRLSDQSWIYALSLFGFLAGFLGIRNILRRPKAAATSAPTPALPDAEQRLLLRSGEVQTLFAGGLTLTVEKIYANAAGQPEMVDFRLESPGTGRQRFKKIPAGSRLKYEGAHPYELTIVSMPAPENLLAMRIKRLD